MLSIPSQSEPNTPKRRRKGVPEYPRKALRQYYFDQTPKPTQRKCAQWFLQEYDQVITQGTVSESLSEKWKFLDELEDISTSTIRRRDVLWPHLESRLAEWKQQVDAEGGTVTGESL